MNSNQGLKFKVIVIGESNVGKTTLTYRFCEGRFLDSAEATVGVDFRTKVIHIDGEPITLQLWDTAGQERYRMSMVRHYYRNTDAVVLVYDVADRASYDSLKKWIDESSINCLPDVPKILIGNKCDKPSVVPTHEALRFADQHNMALFETSAQLDSQCDNVESIFITLAHKLKNHRQYIRPDLSPTLAITDAPIDVTDNRWGCC